MSDSANLQEPVYRIPQGLRVYAIGDIHGHAEALDCMHETIAADLLESPPEDVHIIYLGDYIDRGPDSRGVIERLSERCERGDGIRKSFLLGNHEAGIMEYLRDPGSQHGQSWTQWGGIETLASYGIMFEGGVALPAELQRGSSRLAQAMPDEHFAFLRALPLYIEVGDYLFAHAGRHPLKDLKDHEPHELHFIRDPFLNWHESADYKPLPKRVVHGHTITPDKQPEIYPHRINVDTGLYDGGPLTAAVSEDDQVRLLQVK